MKPLEIELPQLNAAIRKLEERLMYEPLTDDERAELRHIIAVNRGRRDRIDFTLWEKERIA